MNLKLVNIKKLRKILFFIGMLSILIGCFLFSKIPGDLILNYLSYGGKVLTIDTIEGINYGRLFIVIVGGCMVLMAIFWPRFLLNLLSKPKEEILFGLASVGTAFIIFISLAFNARGLMVWQSLLIIIIIGVLLFLADRKFVSYSNLFFAVFLNRWVAFIGYLVVGVFFFFMRFPLKTWNEFIFHKDFPMFQYTAWLDLQLAKQYLLYGWEPYFSCGFPTFLNLRSILIPYLPFSLLPPALAFHLMLFTTYLTVPLLVYWLARELSCDLDAALFSGWAAVGIMTTYLWNILDCGMAPTFESLPFVILATLFFVRALKGNRGQGLIASLFWSVVAYIHFGHFAHIGLVLCLVTIIYIFEERSLRAAWLLARVTGLVVFLAMPYLILFFHYRSMIILTNMFSFPDQRFFGILHALLNTISNFIPVLNWMDGDVFGARVLPNFFALTSIFSMVILYLLFIDRSASRKISLIYLTILAIAAQSWIPNFDLFFQRMVYLVPPFLAIVLGLWMEEGKRRSLLLPCYLLLVLLFYFTGFFWWEDHVIPTLKRQGDFDREVVEKVKTLSGNYILFEDTASLNPYLNPRAKGPQIPTERDVHSEGFLRLQTDKRFFSHPGYNPHPYYNLRGTYIASGTYLGKDLREYSPEYFKTLFRKWGIEYLVLWSNSAKTFFGSDRDYQMVLQGHQYAIYRFTRSDPCAVVTSGGMGEVTYPDHLTAVVTLKNVTPGGPVILKANYFPEWQAQANGKTIPLNNFKGQIQFLAPDKNCRVILNWPGYRSYFLFPALGLIVGFFLAKKRFL